MGLRTHLVTAHTNDGEFHRDCAKAHSAFAKTLSDGPERDFHSEMSKSHLAHAEKCIACARSASELEDGISTCDTHGPTKILSAAERFGKMAEVVGAIPDNPHVTAVPRFGAPTPEEVEKSAEATLAQHPAFARRDINAGQ
jgi:hypothetical protein